MDLTPKQKEAILRATKEQDYCTIAHKRTMESLWNKGIMEPTNGFGYRFGAIYQLTEKGKELQRALANICQRMRVCNVSVRPCAGECYTPAVVNWCDHY